MGYQGRRTGGGQRRIYNGGAYHCRRWDIKGEEQGEDRGEYIKGVHSTVEGEISREKNRGRTEENI